MLLIISKQTASADQVGLVTSRLVMEDKTEWRACMVVWESTPGRILKTVTDD